MTDPAYEPPLDDAYFYYLARLLTDNTSLLDDLVQEARISVWKTWADDPLKPRQYFVVTAKHRMLELLSGTPSLGSPGVRGRVMVKPSVYLDGPESARELSALCYTQAWEMTDPSMAEALASLTRFQQEYVFLRFWAGLDPFSRKPGMIALCAQFPVLRKRSAWKHARIALRKDSRVRALAGIPESPVVLQITNFQHKEHHD